RRNRIGERVAAVRGAEDGAAEAQDAGDVARRQTPRAVRLDESVEAVFEADAVDAAVVGRLHDSPNDGVQPWRVAAAGENADAHDSGGHCSECSRRVAADRPWYNAQGRDRSVFCP